MGDFARKGEFSATAQPSEFRFWRSFDDPLLERLVDETLFHNHDLRIALANYEQARAMLRGTRLDRFPTLTANALVTSTVENSADFSSEEERYEVGIGAIWELDFIGRIRRSVEAQRAQAQADAADLAALQVSVVSELARTYFQLRGLQEQLSVLRTNASNQARTQQLLQVRQVIGVSSGFDVERSRTQLEGAYAGIPVLEAEIAFSIHRLTVLTGKAPGALVAELEAAGSLPSHRSFDMAVGTPGDLLRRRPDVAAAERRLAAATALIGVATADLFPRFNLGGLIGTQAVNLDGLFQRDSQTRMVSLGIDGTFLNVGRVRARIAATNASAAAHLAAYERTVLVALEEAENALIRVSRSERELKHLHQATEASARAVNVSRVRFETGSIDLLELLDAERASLLAEDAYVQGRLRCAQARLALFQALAGGWSPVHTEHAGS